MKKDFFDNVICEGDYVAWAVGSGYGGSLRLGIVVGLVKDKIKIKGIAGARGGAYYSDDLIVLPAHLVESKYPPEQKKK